MSQAQRNARMWMGKLDALAAQANVDLQVASERSEGQSDYGIGLALIAIASQLAYGNAVAAATFYMQNTLWISLESERGDA